MAQIKLKHPIKPCHQVGVDYSHWLAPYLSAFYLGNESGATSKMQDITQYANHGTPTGTTMQWGSFGRERVFNGSSDKVAVSYGRQLDSTTKFPNAHHSVLIFARVKSTGGAGASQNICSRLYDGTANIPFFLGIGGINAANGVGYYASAFQSSGITTDIRGDGKYHTVCGILASTPGNSGYWGLYYVDGVRDKTAILGSYPGTGTLALNIGADYTGANNFNGVIESLQIFAGVPIPDFQNGLLPADHAIWLDNVVAGLHNDPYQLLSFNKTNVNFMSSAAASGNISNFFMTM